MLTDPQRLELNVARARLWSGVQTELRMIKSTFAAVEKHAGMEPTKEARATLVDLERLANVLADQISVLVGDM